MPLVRPPVQRTPLVLVRPRQSFLTPPLSIASSQSRSVSASSPDHEDRFDPPGGWLFGVPPGEKYKKEGWENIWMYGFFGSLGLAVVAYAFKPDTSIQTWALEEARRRLEAEGILKEPEDK
ncbi:hypothetical protein FGG08_001700 [Glutinoglossum americanum]|uniref:NADH dehydrogenase [ubiquinone] 1 beta subcomplex subunit 11, mitochondrial n=1 Tax=Glutinoglossum americanum TaxID=1670608 RepID=A0A9P8KZZ6_9PEZI|nr:hypothetical protein FGG08_001700 [Glutinoglossum americanum]